MKKFLGINRNKFTQFQNAKLNNVKRKNRFKNTGKDESQELTQPPQTNSLITSSTQNSSGHEYQTNKVSEIYEEAKQNLKLAMQFKKKITNQCKLRITAFKESEAKKHDQNICFYSKKAIQCLLKAEKTLSVIRHLQSFNACEEKYYRNMEKSLAQQLRELSKQLRSQQKQHFDRIKSYEKGTANSAIQLSETQKEQMKCDVGFDEDSEITLVKQLQNSSRDSQISQLIRSINTLSNIYKDLNTLVIEQGTIIDRIDFNIEETFTHVEKGNEHLKRAEQNASSPCAQKCMIVLLVGILVLAIILGLKYAK